jgi:putative copper resistance protein D
LDLFIIVRAVHFAATAMVAGTIFFLSFVAAPALRPVSVDPLAAVLSKRLRVLLWIALLVSAFSGLLWLLLLSARIAGQDVTHAIADGIVWTVLTDTRFGNDWTVRLCLAILLAGTLYLRASKAQSNPPSHSWVVLLLAACFIGSLAWSGHAGASPGIRGDIHLGSDVFHLVAVAAWVGALPALAILLSSAPTLGPGNNPWTDVAVVAGLRFSSMGILSVCTLIATGLVNTLNLAGSVTALIQTEYGELLLLKIFLFIAMVGVAAVNRLRLLPRLADANTTHPLRRNVVLEIALATVIMFVVGALGTMPPGEHIHVH